MAAGKHDVWYGIVSTVIEVVLVASTEAMQLRNCAGTQDKPSTFCAAIVYEFTRTVAMAKCTMVAAATLVTPVRHGSAAKGW